MVRVNKVEEQKKKAVKAKTPVQLRRELERLNLLFQKGRIEWDYYNQEYSRIESELNELASVRPEKERDFSYLDDLFKTDFRSIYASLSLENKRAFWRTTIEQILLNDDFSVKCVDFL